MNYGFDGIIALWLVELSSSSSFVCLLCSVRVRGQHTKTTGRKGRTVGVSKKK